MEKLEGTVFGRPVVCFGGEGRGFLPLLFVVNWRAQRICYRKMASPTVSWANPTLALIVPAPLTPFISCLSEIWHATSIVRLLDCNCVYPLLEQVHQDAASMFYQFIETHRLEPGE